MNIHVAWNRGLTGSGVVVTIVDDGIEYDHEDLQVCTSAPCITSSNRARQSEITANNAVCDESSATVFGVFSL